MRRVNLGVKLDATKKKIKFLQDQNILTKEVAVTCKNCGMKDCPERAALSKHYLKKLRPQALNEDIERFIA